MIYIYIYKREKKKYYYKKWKREIKEEREGGFSSFRPLLSSRLMIYTHHLCVWLKPCWSPELDHVQPSNHCSHFKASSTYDVGKNTQVCKGNKMFTNTISHVCLHKNMILLIHTSLAYDICSGLDGLVNSASIGLFELSVVLRLKRPSLIKFRHGV